MDFADLALQYRPYLVGFGPVLLGVLGWLWTLSSRRFQQKMASEAFRRQGDTASLHWGNEAIDALSEAQAVAEGGPDAPGFEERRQDVLWRISSLVDRGRMFFPNLDMEGHQTGPAFLPFVGKRGGSGKERAFTGNRPPIIDTLMYAYYELRSVGDPNGPTAENSANFIFRCRRLFVTALQAYLDPHRYDDLIDRYSEQNRRFRDDMIVKSGELGVVLDARRAGLLTQCEGKDFGWSSRVSADRRREILHEVQAEPGMCPPIDGGDETEETPKIEAAE